MYSPLGHYARMFGVSANGMWYQVYLLMTFVLTGLSASAQVSLRLVLHADGQTYAVYMRSAVDYTGRSALISTTQVTLAVPHGLAAERFEITDLTSPIPNMTWRQADRVDAPPENPDRDYLFFSFINNNSPTVLFNIPAGQDILLFQFKRKGPCSVQAQLIDNGTDEFRTPNSKGINTGNSVSILGAGGNVYAGNINQGPTVQIHAAADSVCGKQSLELQAELTNPTPAVTYRYQWFADEQPISPVLDTPVFTYFVPGSATGYQVRIRVKVTTTGTLPCDGQLATATKSVFVKAVPTAKLTYTGETCTPLPVTLSAQSIAKASYTWMLNNQAVTTGPQPSFVATVGGTYSVAVTVNGCSASSDLLRLINVSKAERTSVRIGTVGPLVAGQSVRLAPQISNATSFTWSPADQLSSTTVADPVITAQLPMSYTLTVQSDQGCVASDTVTLIVVPTLFIPTAFTPNGDGVNDTWVIQNISYHQPCRLQVVNRWGDIVYDQSPYRTPWDAAGNGVPLEPGLYQYVLTTLYTAYSGSVQIIR
ncbi:gliding motility-associated-like protein [Spirosoma oryzae]|uniref:Gliding motility-associated-like protein n=1 Tax=Spirosoma oryzae TaxID=1469603 RepID=A0A2T0S0V5_9BACT|nr:gliding motility-associated C-terminal domain-containing protein [Spirosoma oryzae]PRY27030.1 gliding motility-associated-like protein [Spirosoma oryzae]